MLKRIVALLLAVGLLLGLSGALLLVTCLLLSWFVAQGHRHNAGILRMLGGSKQKVLICILL